MPLTKPVASWTEADLQQLIDLRVEESLRIEYKQELNLLPEGKRKEACKDTSGFANAEGGVIIFGIKEEVQANGTRLPIELTPLTQGGLKERLENICLSGVTPRFTIRIHTINSANGGYYLIADIPQSFAGVHMVTLGNENRYYKRRNYQVLPMTEEEIRHAYSRIQQAREDFEAVYLEERYPNPAAEGTWISCVTIPLYTSDRMVDPRKVKAENLLKACHGRCVSSHFESRPDYYESRSPYNIEQPLSSCTRIRFSGVMEYIYSISQRNNGNIYLPIKGIIERLNDCLLYFGDIYNLIGYYGPLRIFYRVSGAKGSLLAVSNSFFTSDNTPFPEDEYLYSMDTNAADIRLKPLPVIHEIMDNLWIAYGWERCFLFNSDGTINERLR